MRQNQIFAWLIHGYTAIGGILGIFALWLAANDRIHEAYILLVLQMVVDATDGMLARRIRIKEVLPNFDGGTVDNVIDMFTYIWIPLFIILDQNLLPHPVWLILPAYAAMYAYGQTNMKTDDGYFIGFPSYWNIIALYLYWLRPDGLIAVLLVTIPALLSFVPTRYLYPSKGYAYWKTAWGLGMVWVVLLLVLLLQPKADATLVVVSLFYPIWYIGASFWLEFQSRRSTTVSAI